MAEHERTGVERRDFLRRSAAAAAAGGLVFGDWGTRAEAATLSTRVLGRTGLKVTELTFGAIQLNSTAHDRVLEHAIDQGVNLVHVAPGYQNGKAMEVVGRVMQRKRAKVFIALKAGPYPNELENCLRVLNTDYVDILVPPVTNPNEFQNERLKNAFAALKQQGKIRFSGFAGHSNEAACVQAANAAGFWDTCLLRYHVQNREQLDPVVNQAARGAKIGFMVMKASTGLQRGSQEAFGAGLRNVLGNRNLATLTLGMNSVQQVDGNIGALTARNVAADRDFQRYLASCAGRSCDTCGRCQQACPQGVAINDYLRASMYRQRGDLELADELVRGIPVRHSLAACNHCGQCDQHCHLKLDVVSLLHEAAGD